MAASCTSRPKPSTCSAVLTLVYPITHPGSRGHSHPGGWCPGTRIIEHVISRDRRSGNGTRVEAWDAESFELVVSPHLSLSPNAVIWVGTTTMA